MIYLNISNIFFNVLEKSHRLRQETGRSRKNEKNVFREISKIQKETQSVK
jgi:hypothetical protein